MPRKGKDITDSEPGLWEFAMADVKPLPGRSKPPKKAVAATPVKTSIGRAVTPKCESIQSEGIAPARDLDRRTQQKLERGKMEIEAVLDLHGYGQTQAYEALLRFLQGAHGSGMRCVLVITGKGKMGGGILRTRLPEWVDEPGLARIVLKASPARGHHGGGGAFYVLLRRDRSL